jgi:hypothetical protein
METQPHSSRLIDGLGLIIALVSMLGWAVPGWAAVELAPALRVAPIEPGGGTTGEAAGPVFFYTHRPSRLEWGVRPLFSSLRNEPSASDEFDLLYPLLTRRSRPEGTDVQLLQLIRWSTTRTAGGSTDWMVAPILAYQGKRPDRDEGFAFFPLYGALHQFLGQTHLRFTLFPLWLSLERDQIARHYILWPFIGWATSASESAPPTHGWRFWPFYGELVQEGIKDERFVLWPFFIRQRLHLNTNAPEEHLFLLPFYTETRTPEEQSVGVLWPLWFGRVVKKPTHYTEWDLPWPLIQFGSGDERTIRRVFPFYSEQSRMRTVDLLGKTERIRSSSRLLLWPLYHSASEVGPDWRRDRDRLLLLLYSDIRTQQAHKGDGRRIDLWPLFTYNKTPDGAVTFQTLAPIEPFLNTEPITRNYSPLWSLATYRRDGDTSDFSLLWGLFRWTATERERRLRFFFLPSIHWTKPTAPPSTTDVAPSPAGPAGPAP